jgi:hypothetical protein
MQPLRPFHILFYESGNPKDTQSIKDEVLDFSESYDAVMRKIIDNSITLNRDTFRLNVATLMPAFGMTRRGLFHGVKVENSIIQDPNQILDDCWTRAKDELQDIKKLLTQNSSYERSRAILEIPRELRNCVVAKAAELFDKLEWTTINDSDVRRVAAGKILFATLPEIALPVDNAEWDKVFRTHSYGRVLSTMIEEINEWERKTKTHLETLDPKLPTTVTSIYNVMAMSARP